MSELRNLFRDSSHYLSGQAAALTLGFVSFPILARALTVAEYGMLCLVLQIAATGAVLSKMGLQNSIQRFYQDHATSHTPGALQRFYSTLLLGSVLCTSAVAMLFAAAVLLAPPLLVKSELRNVLLLGSVLIFIRGLQPITLNFLRAERRTKAFNLLDVITRATTIAFTCLLLFVWRRSVNSVLTATILVELVSVGVVVVVLLPRGAISIPAFDRRLLWGALTFGLPLVGYEFAAVILDSGDRLLIQHYLGFQAVGYYSAGYNMASCATMSLMYPVNLALLPIYMKLWATKGPDETRAFLSGALNNFILAAMCLLAVVAVTARDAVVVVGSRKLQQAYPLLPVLVLGLMLYSLHIFFNAGLVIHKKTLTMATIIVSCAFLNVVLNVLLIPRIGLQGAAIATLLSYAIFLAMIARASVALLPLRLDVWACLRYLLAALASVLLARQFQSSSNLLGLVVRALLSVSTYAVVLWAIDRRFRLMASKPLAFADGLLRKTIFIANAVPKTDSKG